MNKAKLKSVLRTFKAHWCQLDECIVSFASLEVLSHYPALQWGIAQNLLETHANGDRIEVYFKCPVFLENLQKTTCGLSGKAVK